MHERVAVRVRRLHLGQVRRTVLLPELRRGDPLRFERRLHLGIVRRGEVRLRHLHGVLFYPAGISPLPDRTAEDAHPT